MANYNATRDDDFATIVADDIPSIVADSHELFEATGQQVPPLLLGPPGVGKTHGVIQGAKLLAEKRGLKLVINQPSPAEDEFSLIIWQMANSSEEVVSGLPWPDKENNVQRRAMVTSLPQSGVGILYMDEVAQAHYTQRFASQLSYDRKLDDYYELPPGFSTVMSGNNARDRAGANKLWTHFANRVQIFQVVADLDGALRSFRVPVKPEVAVYLKFNPMSLHRFDPRKEGPFPSSRTWDFVNLLCYMGQNPVDHFTRFQGLIGHDEATSFRTTYQAVKDLPNLEELFGDPENHARAIRAWQVNDSSKITAIAYVVLRKLDAYRDVDFAAKAIRVFELASPEIAQAFLSIADTIDRRHDDGESVLNTKQYTDYLVRNQRVLAN